jgi:membrane-associated phospholipid phosphatase
LGSAFALLLVSGVLLAAIPAGSQASGQPASKMNGTSESSPCCEAARLAQLLHHHPELLPLVKSYLARQLDSEGAPTEERAISDGMVFSRIQNDPIFARNASQWLVSLAQATTHSLQNPVTEAKGTRSGQPVTSQAQSAAHAPLDSQATGAAATAVTENKTGSVPATEAESQSASSSAPSEASSPSGAGGSRSTVAYAESPALKVSQLPKYLLEDQQAFWTLPAHFRVPDLTFLVPATFGTAFLIGTDTDIESHLPSSPSLIKDAAKASTAGAWGLVGVGGGLFLIGSATHNEHQRETGFLAGEAAIDAYAASTALQYITQRERPFTGNNKGSFFDGGNSFPSNTAAVAWASASVIAHEYPGFLTQLLAYGAAGGVSAGRVIGQKHWTSDAIIGSALGWYMGRQIYRARGRGADISATNWGTFVKSPEDALKNPAYMGTTYVPLDSWVYPVLERLIALGYLPTATVAIRPLPRMECARLILEAQETARDSGEDNNSAIRLLIQSLRQEFAIELANLEGAPNLGIELDSAYARVTAIAGRPLRDSYNFAQTLYDDYGRPYGQGFNTVDGAAVRAETGPLAFYFRGEFQHGSSLPNYTPAQAQQIVATNGIPLLPLSSVPTFNAVSQFRVIEAYSALNISNWQVSFGYQSYWWGLGEGTSLMLSNNATPEPMLKFGRVTPLHFDVVPLAWLGPIRNTAFVGALPDYHFLRGPYPDFPVIGNADQTINPLPYTWGDRISVKPNEWFEMGASVSVIWAGQGRPATLQTWLHTFNSNGNIQTNDPGKRFTGFDLSYRLPNNLFTFYVEGMANDQPSPINSERQSAWNPGLYFPKLPHLAKLDLRVEGVYTNLIGYPGLGRYYQNERYAEGYTLHDQIIGSWVGRQGDGIQAWSTYWFTPRNKIQLSYRRQWVDKALLQGGGLNDFGANVDWLFKHDIQFSSTLQYERWNFPFLSSSPVSNFTTQIQIMYTPSNRRLTASH